MAVIDNKWIAIADVEDDYTGRPGLTILDLGMFLTVWRQARKAFETDKDMDMPEHLYEAGYPEKACRQ